MKHLVLAGLFALVAWNVSHAADGEAVKRGQYLFAASDCGACHTDEKNGNVPLAGGAALKTDFGTFYAPNITPDPEHGIGRWSLADFRRAMREGKGKDGEYLYPIFPYPAFTGLNDQDIGDLYAYLMAQPPSARPNKPHEPVFPLGIRQLLLGWRLLFFEQGPQEPVAEQSAEWNRGRYLAETAAHCQECHTPRNLLGALDNGHAMAGNPRGPDGQKSPNITQDRKTGIGAWRDDEVEDLLTAGQKPDGDFVGSGMADVVKGTDQLTPADRHALIVYLKSLAPLPATPK